MKDKIYLKLLEYYRMLDAYLDAHPWIYKTVFFYIFYTLLLFYGIVLFILEICYPIHVFALLVLNQLDTFIDMYEGKPSEFTIPLYLFYLFEVSIIIYGMKLRILFEYVTMFISFCVSHILSIYDFPLHETIIGFVLSLVLLSYLIVWLHRNYGRNYRQRLVKWYKNKFRKKESV
jgi:hypothetical protein